MAVARPAASAPEAKLMEAEDVVVVEVGSRVPVADDRFFFACS